MFTCTLPFFSFSLPFFHILDIFEVVCINLVTKWARHGIKKRHTNCPTKSEHITLLHYIGHSQSPPNISTEKFALWIMKLDSPKDFFLYFIFVFISLLLYYTPYHVHPMDGIFSFRQFPSESSIYSTVLCLREHVTFFQLTLDLVFARLDSQDKKFVFLVTWHVCACDIRCIF